MNDIDTAASFFEKISAFFNAHPVARWMALAWLFGWMVALVARIVIKRSPWSENVERTVTFLSCVLFSGLAAGKMWDDDYKLIVATIMGVMSPVVYLIVAELLCWKLPKLKPYLSLRKDFADVLSEDNEPTPPVEKVP